MNIKQNELTMGAIKTATGIICAVVITNTVDAGQALFTWLWFRHLMIGIGAGLLLTEGRYWQQWANSAKTTPLEDTLGTAAVATKQAGVAIAEAQTQAPKV